jgi:uncharacterized RDD family membrane protein YckC
MSQEWISAVPREAREYQGDGAGLVTRLLAAAVDGLTVAAVLVAAYGGLNLVLVLIDPRGFELVTVSALTDLTTALLACVVYLAVAWTITGRTYGDHIMGLRVVNGRGTRVRPLRSLVRAALCVAFPIGLLWCAVSPSRRSVQDALLRTSVIYDWRPRREVTRSG